MNYRPTARAIAIGGAIDDGLRQMGWRSNDLVDKLDWSASKVSRIKNGLRLTSATDLAMAIAVMEIKEPERQELLAATEDLHRANGWLPAEMSRTARDRFLTRIQLAASRLDCYSANSVPTQLQSPEFLHYLLGNNEEPEADAAYLAHRSDAQWQFMSASPASRFFIGEAALTRADVPTDVLSDQVHHLLRFAVRPQIKIHLIPKHADIPGCPPFTYLTFNEHRPLIHIEAMNTTAFLEHPDAIKHCRETLTTITKHALSASATRQHLLNLATKLTSSALPETEPPDDVHPSHPAPTPEPESTPVPRVHNPDLWDSGAGEQV